MDDKTIPSSVETEISDTRSKVKYLWVTLDTKLSFWPNMKEVTENVRALSRLMSNTTGLRPSKIKLLMSTIHSILFQGEDVRTEALNITKYCKLMANEFSQTLPLWKVIITLSVELKKKHQLVVTCKAWMGF